MRKYDTILYQIIPKNNSKFSNENFLMFLKTLSSGKKNLIEALKNPFGYRFIVDCDRSNKISFYFETKNQNQFKLLTGLQIAFQQQADVFESDKQLSVHHIYNTLYLPEQRSFSSNKEGTTKRMMTDTPLLTCKDSTVFLFTLGLMTPDTRLTIDFNVLPESKSDYIMTRLSSLPPVRLECIIQLSAVNDFQCKKLAIISQGISSLTQADSRLLIKYSDSWKTSTLSSSEAMNLMQIPSLQNAGAEILERIHCLYAGQTTLKENQFDNGFSIGRLYHPIQKDRQVRIDITALRKHGFISGQTGSGKSSAAEEIIDSILLNKLSSPGKRTPGFLYTDPAETSVLGVIDKILKLQSDGYDVKPLLDKVHYIDFSYPEYIFPISLLNKKVKPTDLIDFFTSLFADEDAKQVNRYMATAISALLFDNRQHHIGEIYDTFENKEFRDQIYVRIHQNPYATDAKQFLKEKLNPTVVTPIRNRIDVFLNNPTKRLMFSMREEYDGLKNIRKWMDEGHIVLFNLKSLNNNDISVIVGYIMLRLYTEALQRPDSSMLFLCFMDESHKTQLPIMEKIVAETRKQGLSIFPMTQYLEQFNTSLLKAILNNVATKISFRQGESAANLLYKNTPNPIFTSKDLTSLPDRIGFLTTEDHSSFSTVMIEARPPYRYTNGELVDYKNDKAMQVNIEKNRRFARSLMQRDFVSRQSAEKIVFGIDNDDLEYEEVLIKEGDGLAWEE